MHDGCLVGGEAEKASFYSPPFLFPLLLLHQSAHLLRLLLPFESAITLSAFLAFDIGLKYFAVCLLALPIPTYE